MNVDKLTGYIIYRSEKHVFIIEDYEIQLIPCNPEKLITYQVNTILDPITKKNEKGFINDIILDGECLDGKNITICVQDSPWISNGIFKYKVNWLYVYNREKCIEDIRGLNFLSQEINYFYDTKQYINDDFELENGCFKNYTVNINSKERTYLGVFKYNKNKIKVFGDMAWKKNYDVSNNLEIWSKISLEFEDNMKDISELYRIVLLQKLVIDVLTYRTNNGFDSIEVYTYNSQKKKQIIGNYYISDEYTKETNYKNVQHLIRYENISNIGKLYELLDEGKIYTSHICGSYKLSKVYNPPRMLGILIAFERIINWKYDKEKFRNDDYNVLLSRIKEMAYNNKIELCNGLSKNKIKFNNTIESLLKPQIPFSTYILNVINDYPVSLSAIKTIYGTNITKRMITDISERINKLRNDMAHGNMDIEFNEVNTKDLKFMEILFYILILSELDLTDDEIINKISWLFNIRSFTHVNNK
jgi:hypothetical protein